MALPEPSVADGSRSPTSDTHLLFLPAAAVPVFPDLPFFVRRYACSQLPNTVRALDPAGKAAGVQTLVCQWPQFLSPFHFFLHIPEGLPVNDGLMVFRHEILWKLPSVLPAFFADGVRNVFLLQKKVSCIRAVCENLLDVGIHPSASVPCGDPFPGKLAFRLKPGLSIQKVLENAPHYCRFLRHNEQLISFPAVSVDPEVTVWNPFLKPLSDSPFAVF